MDSDHLTSCLAGTLVAFAHIPHAIYPMLKAPDVPLKMDRTYVIVVCGDQANLSSPLSPTGWPGHLLTVCGWHTPHTLSFAPFPPLLHIQFLHYIAYYNSPLWRNRDFSYNLTTLYHTNKSRKEGRRVTPGGSELCVIAVSLSAMCVQGWPCSSTLTAS